MMDFEDIMNMDWISNEDTGSANEYSYFVDQPFILDQPMTPIQSAPPVPIPQEEKLESIPMPTLEQLKHLIEAAKLQITMKEQELQTAAPSVIFAPPPAEEPTLSDLLSVQSSDGSVKNEPVTGRNEESVQAEETVTTLEAYAAADGIDLKKLSSKERRQLRNKISARNFRVRRKEYITSLEEQVADHKRAGEELKEKLHLVEDENRSLRKEMDILKKQNQQLQQASLSPRLSSLPKPSIHKDISLLGTKAKDSYRQQQECILVSSAVMPSWDYQSILQKEESDLFRHFAAHFLLFVVQYVQQQQQQQRPLLPDEREFSVKNKNMESLYDTLIESSLMSNAQADKSFLWSH
ncbi:hypothetical protein BY458DRAFT_457630 [Sporodiniella umbellata]|nr:hypothetical protein BY458DRAFT_457630 [Sporodiniella umbellata]